MDHILRQQLLDLKAGIAPSSRVEPGTLSREQRSELRSRLHSLDAVVREIRSLIVR
jgi:hypothetical protein